jgi:DNA helicase HerA-like ATPase
MKDMSDDFTIDKGLLPNLSFRGLIVGRTGSGKTSALGSLLLLPEFYLNDFKGENIYIFSPLKNDFKMETIIKSKEIPPSNISTEYDDEMLGMIYDKVTDNFEQAIQLGDTPEHVLIVLDDLSFSGALRTGTFNNIARVFMNGRKQMVSIILTTQFYHHILNSVRQNASFVMLYNTSLRQLESVMEEHNFLPTKKQFVKMFRDNVKKKTDFILINHDNHEPENLYLDKNFEPILPRMQF